MKELMIFEGHEVEILEVNGTVLFNPYHVGKCLDMAEGTVKDHMSKMSRKQAVLMKNSDVGLTDFRKLNNAGEKFLTESGVYKLVFKSRKPNAEKFTDWVVDEVLPQIRKTGSYSTKEKSIIEQGLIAAKFVADDMRVNTASRLLMYENLCKDFNIPTGFLPKYEHNGNKQMKSATALLKENDCGISAKKFNLLLIDKGYLEIKERPSSKTGETKKFPALTENGLKYGENAVSPKNMRETQPLYYEDTFMELYKEITD